MQWGHNMLHRQSLFALWIVVLCGTEICRTKACPSEDNESFLHPDYEYTYYYKSEATVDGHEGRNAISVECFVQVAHSSECLYNFQMHNCNTTTSSKSFGSEKELISQQSIEGLSRYPISFSLTKGDVPFILTHEDDPIRVLNIKRAAISAFIFKRSFTFSELQRIHSDVHGVCPLTIEKLDAAGERVKIRKNLSQCLHSSLSIEERPSISTLFWNMSLDRNVINSTSDCDYHIDQSEKRIQSVYCKEKHVDLSQDTAQISIFYTMKFMRVIPLTNKKDFQAELKHKKSIVFEFDPPPHHDCNLEEGQKMLIELVNESTDEMKLSTVPLFIDFVTWIESCNDLRPLVDMVESCFHKSNGECSSSKKALGKSYLSDALLQCSSMECFEALSLLMRRGELSSVYKNFVFYIWSKTRHANPQIINAVFNTCKETSSSLCWMSLGTMIRHITLKRENNETHEEFQYLVKIASYLTEAVDSLCSYESGDIEILSRYLKVIKNMGDAYISLVPQGHKKLMKCATKNDVAEHIRLIILKSLEHMEFYKDLETSRQIYETSLKLVLTKNMSTSLRTSAFNLILRLPHDFGFDKEVLMVLGSDDNVQFQSHVAQRVKHLLNNQETGVLPKTLLERLKKSLDQTHISLDKLIQQSSTKSLSFIYKFFDKFPFMSDLMSITSKLYDFYKLIPNQFQTITFWNNINTAFQAGFQAEGFDRIAITVQKYLKEMEEEGTSLAAHKIYKLLEEIIVEFMKTDLFEGEFKFDESILMNVKELVGKYKKYEAYLRPFFNTYFDMFGSTLVYFTSQDVLNFIFQLPDLNKLLEAAHGGVFWNTTRVLRLKEAHLQVPTLMGLALKWKSYSVLATSLQSFFKLEIASDLRSEVLIQPSMALTFINQMVLDFPAVTRLGIQENSSIFSSTQLPAVIQLSENRKSIKIVKPSEPETLLQSYKTKQLIKNFKFEDYATKKTGAISSSWCTSDYTSSILGMEFCLEQSQPAIRNSLSDWNQWHLFLKPTNKISTFDVEVTKYPPNEEKRKSLGLRTLGGDKIYELFLHVETDDRQQKTVTYVTIPSFPEFMASFKSLSDQCTLSLKLEKNLQYSLTYSNTEKYVDAFELENELAEREKIKQYTRTRLITVTTPFSVYAVQRKDSANGEDMTADVYLSYENKVGGLKWLERFFPASLWETSNKAWIQLHLNWKGDSTGGETTFWIKTPASTSEINKKTKENNGIIISMTKTESNTSEVQAYINLSFDNWSSEIKEVAVWNVTIPKQSWSIYWHITGTNSGKQYQIELKQVSLLPKNSFTREMVGIQNCDEFDKQENQVKAVIDIDFLPMNSEDLLDINELYRQEIQAKATFHFNQHSVSANGRIIISGGQTSYRFQESFVMESSSTRLQLRTHSLYHVSVDGTSFHHKTFVTHLLSQTEASNIMDYKRFVSEDGCKEFSWAHDIRSYFFDSTTRASHYCHPNSTNLQTLKLKWTTNSSYWKTLNMKVDQIFDDIHVDRTIESCNITFSNSILNVTAEWNGPHRDHKKTALRTCMSEDCQNVKFYMEYLHNGVFFINLDLPGAKKKKFSFSRNLSEDASNLKLQLKYSSDEKDEVNDAIELTGKIQREDFHVWRATISPGAFPTIQSVLTSAFKEISYQFMDTIKDSQHPLNELLRPAIKQTVYRYLQDTKEKVQEIIYSPIKEILATLQEVYEAPITLLYTSAKASIESALDLFHLIKEKPIITWAIDQLNLSHYVHKTWNLSEFMKVWNIPQKDGNYVFEFTTGEMLKLSSFKKLPSISFNFFAPSDDVVHQPFSTTVAKIEVVSDSVHVCTFDGFSYAFVPADCSFLMAHDLKTSLLSVIISGKSVHVLFPEMTVTINHQNQAFVNGSTVAAELPIQTRSLRVGEKGSSVVEVSAPSFRVKCKKDDDFSCMIELDNWHNGGTFGLLGNADGIWNNEFMLPDGKVSTEIVEFIHNYEISRKQECKNVEISSSFIGKSLKCKTPSVQTCEKNHEVSCL